MASLVRVVNVKRIDPLFPITVNTLYNWHHKKKHPELFQKLGGVLLFDLEGFYALFEKGESHD